MLKFDPKVRPKSSGVIKNSTLILIAIASALFHGC
jgi:hypothetical protein